MEQKTKYSGSIVRKAGSWALFCVLIIAIFAASLQAKPPSDRSEVAPRQTQRAKVTYTANTVVLTRQQVKKLLVAVSKDRKALKFKSHATLKKVKKGKVLLLTGADVGKVTRVSRKKGKITVTVTPVKLTEVIKSGTISMSTEPDFRKAFSSASTALNKRDGAKWETPSYPYVDRVNKAEEGNPVTISGSLDNYSYAIQFVAKSKTRMNYKGTISYKSLGSNGLLAVGGDIKFEGYLELAEQDLDMSVQNGTVSTTELLLKQLNTNTRMTYVVTSGSGTGGVGNPPVFRMPISLIVPMPIGATGIPFFLKLQAAVVLKLGVTSSNSTIQGGQDITSNGTTTLTQNGATTGATQSGGDGSGTILDKNTVGASSSALPAAVVIAFQLPKIGFGLGVAAANGVGYFDVITTMTQETGFSLLGIPCSSYALNLSLGAGFEAQIGSIGIDTPRTRLLEKDYTGKEPGC